MKTKEEQLAYWQPIAEKHGQTYQKNQWWSYILQNNQGKYHSDGNAPSVIFGDGTLAWHQNGQEHRIDGPAFIWPDGSKRYYLYGTKIDLNRISLEIEGNNVCAYVPLEWLKNQEIGRDQLAEFIRNNFEVPVECQEPPMDWERTIPDWEPSTSWDDYFLEVRVDLNSYTCEDLVGCWVKEADVPVPKLGKNYHVLRENGWYIIVGPNTLTIEL